MDISRAYDNDTDKSISLDDHIIIFLIKFISIFFFAPFYGKYIAIHWSQIIYISFVDIQHLRITPYLVLFQRLFKRFFLKQQF